MGVDNPANFLEHAPELTDGGVDRVVGRTWGSLSPARQRNSQGLGVREQCTSAFQSFAQNLTAEAPVPCGGPPRPPCLQQVYVRDRLTGTTALVSRKPMGALAIDSIG